jgi:hypothetical protein
VDKVLGLQESLTHTARRLHIKLSTAKLILKKYKKTGQIFDKKMRNAKKEETADEMDLPLKPVLSSPPQVEKQ